MADYSKQLFPDVEDPVGNWISIGHPAVAEICAHGFDFVVIGTEHTDIGLESLGNLLRAVESVDGEIPAFVRVPGNDPDEIKRVLDLGPAGIIVPMVEDAEQARRAAMAMRYPPDGNRGVAPGRASDYGRTFEEYFERADQELTTIVQIETTRGVENADEIVAVDGVDAVLVGQGDLSSSLGIPAEWESEEFQSALDTILDSAHDAGKPVCMLAIEDGDIPRWVEAGVDFLIAGVDASYLVAGSDAARAEYEEVTSADRDTR